MSKFSNNQLLLDESLKANESFLGLVSLDEEHSRLEISRNPPKF